MKVAFVVQRCGAEVVGGSEAECLTYARLLSTVCEVEIITTCAQDYMTWADSYPSGKSIVEGVVVRRFPVDEPRDVETFNQFSESLYAQTEKSLGDCETWLKMQGPYSSELLKYLEQTQDQYHRIVFFTYLYGTTYYGVQQIRDAEKIVLVPTAHDEPPAHLPVWPEWYKQIDQFIFNTPEEKVFLEGLLDRELSGATIGMGPNVPDKYSGIDFRQEYDLYSPFLLYVGRIDETKGAHSLAEMFVEARDANLLPRNLKLVYVGKEVQPLPKHEAIINCGFVSDANKFGAIEACEMLVNPSPFESLSIVLLEAWSVNKPVLVNGDCEVMVGQTKRFGAGAAYTNLEEFVEGVSQVSKVACMGLSARVSEEYGEEAIVAKLRTALGV